MPTVNATIEIAAQSLRADQAARADLLLDCVPADAIASASAPRPGFDRPTLRVLTKSDLLDRRPPESDTIVPSASTGERLTQLWETGKLNSMPNAAQAPRYDIAAFLMEGFA